MVWQLPLELIEKIQNFNIYFFQEFGTLSIGTLKEW